MVTPGCNRQWRDELGTRIITMRMMTTTEEEGGATMMGHTTINKEWGLGLCRLVGSATTVNSKSDGFLLMMTTPSIGAGWPMHALFCFCWWRRFTAWCTVLLGTSNFKNQASIMACRTLTPVVVWRIHMADLTFFWCAALFFDMLESGMYSVEID